MCIDAWVCVYSTKTLEGVSHRNFNCQPAISHRNIPSLTSLQTPTHGKIHTFEFYGSKSLYFSIKLWGVMWLLHYIVKVTVAWVWSEKNALLSINLIFYLPRKKNYFRVENLTFPSSSSEDSNTHTRKTPLSLQSSRRRNSNRKENFFKFICSAQTESHVAFFWVNEREREKHFGK